jgi:hypothetical protein
MFSVRREKCIYRMGERTQRFWRPEQNGPLAQRLAQGRAGGFSRLRSERLMGPEAPEQ